MICYSTDARQNEIYLFDTNVQVLNTKNIQNMQQCMKRKGFDYLRVRACCACFVYKYTHELNVQYEQKILPPGPSAVYKILSFVLFYKRNIKHFSVLIYSYINTRENWKNSKLYENTPPCGRRVSTQFLVFPISTRVDITVYQHGKCFIFLKY